MVNQERGPNSRPVGRRFFLQSAAVPITLGGISGTALGDGNGESGPLTYLVQQGGTEAEIDVISSTVTVEEYLGDLSGIQAVRNGDVGSQVNVPGPETSELALFDGANGLSLVVSHERGTLDADGSASFTFHELPDGEWVTHWGLDGIEDDGDEVTVSWNWTDINGGASAYRFDESVEEFGVAVSPFFEERVDTWRIVGDQRGQPIAPDESVAMWTDGATPPGVPNVPPELLEAVETAADEKRALAGHVASISASIDETARVDSTLSEIETAVENGELNPTVALDAIERKKLGADVSENALAGLGLETSPSPRDPDTRIGASDGSPAATDAFSMAETVVENSTYAALGIVFSTIGVANMLGRISSRALTTALEGLENAVSGVAGLLPYVGDDLKESVRGVASDLKPAVLEDGIENGGKLLDSAKDSIISIRDTISERLLGALEQGPLIDSFEDRLKLLNESLALDSLQSNGLQGSLEGAKDEAENAQKYINRILDSAMDRIETGEIIASVTDLVGAGAILITLAAAPPLSLAAGALAICAGMLSVGLSVAAALRGLDEMFDVLDRHNAAIEEIIVGGQGSLSTGGEQP